MGFIAQNTEIPIYTKSDMVKYKMLNTTLYEFTLWHKKPPGKKVTIPAILKICCYVARATPEEVQSRSRKDNMVFARQTAQYFSALLTEETATKIGQDIGGRHHATVGHSIKTIRIAADPEWHDDRREDIMLIARLLEEKYRVGVHAHIKYDRENPDRNERMCDLQWRSIHQ